jgi:hypothetical protein
MEKQEFFFSKWFDRLLAFGGTGGGLTLLGACMTSIHIPHEAVLMTVVSFGLGALGISRLQKRHYEKLLEQVKNPPQPAIANPAMGDLEIRLLDMLALKKGQFSLIEAVVLLREPIDKVLPILEKLQRQGMLGTEVSDTGEIIYTSSAFQLGSPRLA